MLHKGEKMTKIIIFGLEQFAEQMYGLLNNSPDVKVEAFCVDREYMPSDGEWGGYSDYSV